MDSRQDKEHVSRRALLRTGAVTGAAAATAAGSIAAAGTAAAATSAPAHRSTSPARDLILYNGRIYTMDGAGWPRGTGTVASVVAIRGGVISYVGTSLRTARQQFTGSPRAIDLGGRVAVPDSALRSLHSVLTVIGGAVVHEGAIQYWASA
jgi:hypothetical protein